MEITHIRSIHHAAQMTNLGFGELAGELISYVAEGSRQILKLRTKTLQIVRCVPEDKDKHTPQTVELGPSQCSDSVIRRDMDGGVV